MPLQGRGSTSHTCRHSESEQDTGRPVRPLAWAAMHARIRSITFDCPDPQTLASFYAELLGLRLRLLDSPGRVEIGRNSEDPRLAFAAVSEYRPPTWPDPSFPQQIHLDLPAYDADPMKGTDEQVEPNWFSRREDDRVLRLGAKRLPHLGGGCPVYADPAGHPFCLCAGPGQDGSTPPQTHPVFDCFDSPRGLASFYAELLDMHTRRQDSPGWVIIEPEDGTGTGVSFGGANGEPPRWPDSERPQQVHLDIAVDDLVAAQDLVTGMGATELRAVAEDHTIYADPEGHPFCLYADEH